MEQEFSFSGGFVLLTRCLFILSDFRAYEPALVAEDAGIGAFEVGLTVAERFYLRTEQGHTGFELIDKLEIHVGFFIYGHGTSLLIIFVRF